MKRLHRAARLAAALGAMALAPAALADTIRLENGRTMHGTVDRGYVDPEYLRIQLFTTGGVVRVRWEHLIAEDRDSWQQDLGLKETEEALELKVDAHKVLFINNLSVVGLVLNPEALSEGPAAEIRIQSKGKVDVYPRGQIAGTPQPVRVDLELIYTPRQAYEIKRDQINPNNGPTHFDLAEYARAVRAYEEAKDHFTKAKEDPDFLKTPQGKQIDSRLATLEILLRNKALQADLDRVKVALIDARVPREFARTAQIYLEARDAMFRIQKQYEDKKIQAEFRIPDLAKRVETERRSFFQRRMPTEVYRWLRQAAYEKSREQKVKDIPPGTDRQQVAILQMKGTFEGARQYFTRQATEDLWNHLARASGAADKLAELQKIMEKDPSKLSDADKERAKRLAEVDKSLRAELVDFWQNRARTGGYTTSYGYGSFIVVKSDLKLVRKQPQGGSQGRTGNRPGGQQQQAVDVIRTPDQWWEDANVNDRTNWLLSWYAEKSNFLEVARVWDENCDNCGGLGYRRISSASTGEEEAERCKSCNGCKVIHKVRWR